MNMAKNNSNVWTSFPTTFYIGATNLTKIIQETNVSVLHDVPCTRTFRYCKFEICI